MTDLQTVQAQFQHWSGLEAIRTLRQSYAT